jgi:nucleoid DNA-binding protein
MADEKTAAKPKSITKSVFFAEIAEKTGLKKTQVAEVFDAINGIIVKQLGSKGPRVITIPGLLKLKSKRVDKVKGGQKKINPLTGKEYVTKDKPAHTKVTARPLKGLKELLK